MPKNTGIEETISDWQRRLLQLDRRNNLLYFKSGRAIRILGRTPDDMSESLLAARSGLRFDYIEPRRGDAEPDDEPDIRGDLETDLPVRELQKRLNRDRRRDTEYEQEQGLNVLFVALGVLQWIDEDGERAESPLILIPCDLERASPRDPFRLQRESDDASENGTLRHKLAQAGVVLPELAEMEPSEYLAEVTRAVRAHREWSVQPNVYLATFAYSKLAMWEDLEHLRIDGTDHELVRELAGDKPLQVDRDSLPSPLPPDSELLGGGMDDLGLLNDLRRQFTVLPADASQLRAIEAARSGANLVIHGPPGTGKSQTIANIIATALGEGKRILFVSEKTAALDVVKRRLEECGLETFLLDLHSERGKKASVYGQLRQSVEAGRPPVREWSSYDDLRRSRDTLNAYVRALHQKRDPLGRSVYQMNGAYAAVQDAPRAEFLVAEPRDLSEARLNSAIGAANRIALRPEAFREHDTSRWLPLTVEQPSVQLVDLLRADMDAVAAAVDQLTTDGSPLATWLGVAGPRSADDIADMERLSNHLAASPGVPRHWLVGDVPERLRRIAREQAEIQTDYRKRLDQAGDWFKGDLPTLPYEDLATKLRLPQADEATLQRLFGQTWAELAAADPGQMHRTVSELMDRSREVRRRVDGLVGEIGLAAPRDWPELDALVETGTQLIAVNVVPDSWLIAGEIDALRTLIEEARAEEAELHAIEARMRDRFSDAVLDEADEAMLRRFRVDYQSFFARLFGGFRQDQKVLRGYMPNPTRMDRLEAVAALEAVEAVRLARAQWETSTAARRSALGGRFRDVETDWDEALAALDGLSQIRARWTGEPDSLQEIVTSPDRIAGLRAAIEALVAARDALRTVVPEPTRNDFESQPIGEVGSLASAAAGPLRTIDEATVGLRAEWTQTPPDLSEVLNVVEICRRVRKIESDAQRAAADLRADFGDRFDGLDTDWEEIGEATEWSSRLCSLAGMTPSDTLAEHASEPADPDQCRSHARYAAEVVAAFSEAMHSATRRFQEDATQWRHWTAAPLAELAEWAADIAAAAPTANDWLEYRAAGRDLDAASGAVVGDVIRGVTDDAAQVPRVVQRRLIGAWLDAVAKEEPTLAAFSARDHEEIRSEFRALDTAFPAAARARVRLRCLEAYPQADALGMRSGQIATLRAELSKKRKQLPIRKLFQRIPHVLLALKPCVLLSPLAVSQLLPRGEVASESIEFDTVIFDEASQVFPEDAVPAMLRARQVIVVGDQQQLPPTSFFRRAIDDDSRQGGDEDDEVEDAFEGRDSILDVLVGQIGGAVAQSWLGVHYRSRHDSLIRFSNHYFYEDRLLVFPQPEIAQTGLGIQDVYLPHGRYDAGASRTNRVEAEEVVERVIHLMETRPTETVGVVALSRAQSDLITELVIARRLDRLDLEEAFAEDRHEPFFVKNLENVQGDERDHVILSIGYGPTVGSGGVPNRFGPLIHDGGQRRLNVAVTRARRTMTLVHSLRPSDVVSTMPGAQLLRRYLEYARDPVGAFEREVILTPDGDPESPFEDAVRRALEARGHQVDSQVGVSGYRIDLGVRSVDGANYTLGIECDGYSYHASPTARDRDWLRQEVLEGLGWCIHRVWSTAWVRNPDAEIERIEEALERCRDRQEAPWVPAEAPGQDPRKRQPSSPLPEPAPAQAPLALAEPTLFQPYKTADLSDVAVGPELQHEVHGTMTKLIVRVLEQEGPVHMDAVTERIRDRYGLGRAGRVIRERVSRALRLMERAEQLVRLEDESEGDFFMAADAPAITPRAPALDYFTRPIDGISNAELQVGLVRVLAAAYGATREELISETARQFGYQRTGEQIAARLGAAVDGIVANGLVTDSFGMLSLREPPVDATN